MTTGTQTFAGAKSFNSDLNVNGLTIGKGSYTGGGANDNTALGFNSLVSNTTGNFNTAGASWALPNSTTGSYNAAFGHWTLTTNTTGSYNTALGAMANVGANNLTNATAIGYGTTVSASNTIQLGNASVTDVKTNGAVTAASFKKSGGTSSQYLMADGSTTTLSAVTSLSGGTTGLTPATATTGAVTLAGTLAVANGGTGATTAAAALTNLGAAPLASPTFTGTVTIPTLSVSGKAGIGVTPTANLHIKAGTATANTAPIKLTAGTNLTTAEAGAIEFDGTNLYFTNSSNVRQTIATLSTAVLQGD